MFCFCCCFLFKKARRKNDEPFCKFICTRLASHDYLNLEFCHHQMFAVIIIFFAFLPFRLQSYAFSSV